MSSVPPLDPVGRPEEPLLDVLLRDTLPEIKLELGRNIDRENARALPERYAQLLPPSVLVVTLRPDTADALLPLAREIERELTDSCMRHGSLYDREYRVQLHRAEHQDVPLFVVTSHSESELAEIEAVPISAPAPTPEPVFAPGMDPDATRVDSVPAEPPGWEAGRFLLVVEDLEGEEREVFRLTEPLTTVGRRSDDPRLRSTVSLADVPHVSRRQLVLVWEPRGDEPGFRVYNLGLNPVHLGGQEIPGANRKHGALHLEELQGAHTEWLPVDEPLRIGEHGPVLRIQDLPAPEEDPDATRFG
ncbi:MAG TPA: FHA domain-containing protein [Longimicrobiaceae bacterium]|nr:FHA domain-containing protein [Longimicrobiaceae bacterium]